MIKVFCSLYDEGLIYRGYRLVNWDVSLQSAISDLEVMNEEETAKIWCIAYKNKNDSITVATTRPETMFGM